MEIETKDPKKYQTKVKWVYKQKKTNNNRENRRNRKNRNRIIENVKSRKKFLFWNA